MKDDLDSKQQILSIILKKRQSKFKRIPGTSLLQKNDIDSTAKEYLGIKNKNKSSIKTEVSTVINMNS
jgi:hypothetical protein